MILNIDQLGYLAAICTTSAFVPQVFMVWRQRGAPGVSTGMYLIFIIGITFWLFYGIALGAVPVIVANAMTLALATAILGMKLYFERH
jgi:MtN3 and saliva related transmembrane protein